MVANRCRGSWRHNRALLLTLMANADSRRASFSRPDQKSLPSSYEDEQGFEECTNSGRILTIKDFDGLWFRRRYEDRAGPVGCAS